MAIHCGGAPPLAAGGPQGPVVRFSTKRPDLPMTAATMRSASIRLSLGLTLALAFAGVLAVMLCSLVLVLVKSDEASRAYNHAISWDSAVTGAAAQAAGTRQQQSAQALYVATFLPRY